MYTNLIARIQEHCYCLRLHLHQINANKRLPQNRYFNMMTIRFFIYVLLIKNFPIITLTSSLLLQKIKYFC